MVLKASSWKPYKMNKILTLQFSKYQTQKGSSTSTEINKYKLKQHINI